MPADVLTPDSIRKLDPATPACNSASPIGGILAAARDRMRAWATSPLCWLLIGALAVRVVGLERPLVGTFATKAAVHAMEARNWALGRAPIWQPTIDTLADGTRAWHLMEWPAVAYAAGLGWRFCGGSLDAWGRGLSVACSLVSVWLVYRLAARWFGARAAQGAAFVIAFSPVSIVYGQSFLLEASIAALTLTVIDSFDRWLDSRRPAYLAVTSIALGLAVLTKAYSIFVILGMWSAFARSSMADAAHRGKPLFSELLRHFRFAGLTSLLLVVGLLPAIRWYSWVYSVSPSVGPAAEYHPVSRAAIHGFPHLLLFSPAYYARLASDFCTVVLTPFGVLLALLGLADRRFRRHLPLFASSAVLLVLLPLKFMAANYYYVVLLPVLALAAGLGWQRLCERMCESQLLGRRALTCLVVVSLAIALRYAIGPAYRTLDEDRGVVAAAAAARSATNDEEPIATMHGSTLDLLYYCDRTGWAFDVADAKLADKLDLARRNGATKFIVAGLDSVARHPATSELLATLVVEQSGDDWRLYSLSIPASR
jgi:hypothetical protein